MKAILTGQLCCGFVKSEMILGSSESVAPPCVDTPTANLVTNGGFDDETGWTYLENSDPGNRGLFITSGILDAGAFIPPAINSYFRAVSINPDNVNTLSFDLIASDLDPVAFCFIELWAGDKNYVFDLRSLGDVVDTYTITINPGDWSVNAATFSSFLLATPDTVEGIYILIQATGDSTSFTLDNLSLIEIQCI